MVAVFHPETLRPGSLGPVGARPRSTTAPRSGRPHLRVIEGGAGREPATRTVAGLRVDAEVVGAVRVLAVVAVVLLASFWGLRTARTAGLEAAESGGSQGVAAVGAGPATPGSGESVYIVRPGDSLWSIAAGLAPGEDPRPLVDALARRNGGTGIEAGQRLVVPAPR